ncbi:YqaA family protein [Andreprevotia chitinilytica]|uniref:YqaA family protein n=1 Tax=Andreprevotia chitinilytica TaxID=396808 RepID=UPI001FE0EE31
MGGLFASAFLSATLLPGNSEAALAAYLLKWPQQLWPALLIATVGNSLGGAVTVWMGRRIPTGQMPRRVELLQRWGSVLLLGTWLPVIGDALCLAAGWLRWPWRRIWPWLILGKFARYGLIALASHAWLVH